MVLPCIVSFGLEQRGDVDEVGGQGGMIGSKRLFIDGECPSVKRLRPCIISLGLQYPCEIVQAFGYVGVIGSQRFFIDGQRRRYSGSAPRSLCWPAEEGKIVQVDGQARMIGAQHLLVNSERAPVQRFSAIIVSLVLQKQCEIVQTCCYVGMFGPQR